MSDEPQNHTEASLRSKYYQTFFFEDTGERDEDAWTTLRYIVASGYTMKQVGAYFGVAEGTIHQWKARYSEFRKEIEDNTEKADDKVIAALYERATGYSVIESVVKIVGGKIEIIEVVKNYPPDIQAQQYWLNNRQKDKWRSIQHNYNENTNTEETEFDLSNASEEDLAKFEELALKYRRAPDA